MSPENRSNEDGGYGKAPTMRDADLYSAGFESGVRSLLDSLAAVERERDSFRERFGNQMIAAAELIAERDAALARIAAVEAKAERLRGYAEQYLYDGDGGQPLPGYVEVYGAADELSALAASPTPTGPEPAECACPRRTEELHRSRCPLYHEMQGDGRGPSTPTEPTEETP